MEGNSLKADPDFPHVYTQKQKFSLWKDIKDETEKEELKRFIFGTSS